LGDLGYLSFYGLITYGSYALYNSALAKLPTTLVAISGYGQPVIATTLAALLLNEIPSATSFVGALIIVAGLVLATKS
jgi:drug/metabolite transporter (DMT)-like permease